MSLGPVNLSPLISGYIADKHGWRMNFWVLTAFTAVALLLVIFAAPETTYHRPIIYETDIVSNDNLPTTDKDETIKGADPVTQEQGSDLSSSSLEESPRSYWQELLPFRGIQTKDNPLVLLVRLFTCGLYPAVTWSFLVGGTYVAWVRTK